MKCFLFSLALLALASAAPAAVPCDAQADVAARVALALAQAPVTPQAPPAADDRQYCNCISSGSQNANCTCDPDKCGCQFGRPCPYVSTQDGPVLSPTKAPHYTLLIISKSGCVPCEKLRAELMAKWGEAYGDHPGWDIWKDSPGTEAVYGGVTAYPTILLLRRRDGEKVGREIGRHVGYMSTVEMQRWLDHPDAPQSRGEAVEKAAPVVYTPTYQPQPMTRYSAACRGSS